MRSKRFAAGALAATAAWVGGWAQFAPHSFYTSFPLPGHHWVQPLGAYNEHLVRDVGGLYLALLVISAAAAIRPEPAALRLTGAGWLAFGGPHLVFHLSHLDEFGTVDAIGTAGTLGAVVVLAALLVLPPARSRRGAAVGSGARPWPSRPETVSGEVYR